MKSAARDTDAARVMDGLDGEKVAERAVEIVIGDFVVIDKDLLEDGLVESSSDLVTRVAVELVRVLEELQVGLDELDRVGQGLLGG
ncbi:MAG: hypothetical protein R2723_11395 [Microbacterium sp.]